MDNLPVAQEVKDKPNQFIRHPVMLADGAKFVLSEREKMVCEVFIATNGNLSECARQVNARFKRHYSPVTLKKWLNRKQLIMRYVREKVDKQIEVKNFNLDDWKILGLNVLKGKAKFDKIQAQIWRDYGKLEFYREDAPNQQNNTQINIYQADGKE